MVTDRQTLTILAKFQTDSMFKYIFSFLLFFLLIILSAQAQRFEIPERPNPPRYVNDMANFLSEDDVIQLERKLETYNRRTSTAIFIVVLDDVGSYEADVLSVRIGEKWQAGQDEKDNGIIILMSNVNAGEGQRDIDVATGRGVDVAITDIEMHQIINQQIVPYFKEQKYFSGLNLLTDLIIGMLDGEFTASELVRGRSKELEIPPALVIALFFLFVFIMIKLSENNQGVDYNRRGAKRNKGGPIIVSRRGGGWGGFTGGFGGGSFGGGSGGGGGGGGFGGFGGGSFGGGGAGGSW